MRSELMRKAIADCLAVSVTAIVFFGFDSIPCEAQSVPSAVRTQASGMRDSYRSSATLTATLPHVESLSEIVSARYPPFKPMNRALYDASSAIADSGLLEVHVLGHEDTSERSTCCFSGARQYETLGQHSGYR